MSSISNSSVSSSTQCHVLVPMLLAVASPAMKAAPSSCWLQQMMLALQMQQMLNACCLRAGYLRLQMPTRVKR
jgi:hypothetical protein